MSKLTEEHIKEIKHAREVIGTLHRMQDRIYNQLIKDIGFDVYEKEDSYSPEAWLFDIVHNNHLEDIDPYLEKLETKIEEYQLN